MQWPCVLRLPAARPDWPLHRELAHFENQFVLNFLQKPKFGRDRGKINRYFTFRPFFIYFLVIIRNLIKTKIVRSRAFIVVTREPLLKLLLYLHFYYHLTQRNDNSDSIH